MKTINEKFTDLILLCHSVDADDRISVERFEDKITKLLNDFEFSLDRLTDQLSLEDAIKIAKGCHDYNGGHRGDEQEAFHHGIDTVIRALTEANKSGLEDVQVKILHRIGANT